MKDTLTGAPLFYPQAREWMWNYCIYLGPFTDSKGKNYDLGIHMGGPLDVSMAVVDGNEPGSYYSGDINSTNTWEHYAETRKRAKALNLI